MLITKENKKKKKKKGLLILSSSFSLTLSIGDEFYLMEDNKLVCKPDYEAAKQRGNNA